MKQIHPTNYGYLLEGKRQDGNFDYRAHCSVHGTMRDTYPKTFREVLHKTSGKHTGFWNIRTGRLKRWTHLPSHSSIRKSHPYADVLLMLAETYMNKGALDTSIGYINQIRRRANLNDYSGPITKEGFWRSGTPTRPLNSLWKANVSTIYADGDC